MAILVTETYAKYYTAKPGSRACLFCLLVYSLAFLIPLFLTFSTKGTPSLNPTLKFKKKDFFIKLERVYLKAETQFKTKYA